ncbi:MAG: phosphoribosylformylglycinamidine synthase subunit PurS [Campylobacteraceae bacterium]|jgi:phosphoribosylformylglycinamidine synthase|nr:phosphoribosylformylglycinamidine synthase subunit PurS [Campylobacteraceae bacterium]
MRIIANIKLKQGVLDPQGKAIHHALSSLGFSEVENVRIGKQIVLHVNETDKEKAKKRAELMCEELLANTVIEDYEIELK